MLPGSNTQKLLILWAENIKLILITIQHHKTNICGVGNLYISRKWCKLLWNKIDQINQPRKHFNVYAECGYNSIQEISLNSVEWNLAV